MSSQFSDHFGKVAGQYADFRPHYPSALFEWLSAQCQDHDLVWDCGAGSGQASVALAEYFQQVHATDASAGQIAQATAHPRVHYAVAAAESSGLASASADLVTIAQALHWFDLPLFYAEARRVLKPGGVIAAWSYGITTVEGEAVNAAIQHFYKAVIGPYWPAERHHVETGYREIEFPFDGIAIPDISMSAEWSLAQLLGYLRSWSASARYQTATGEDAVQALGQMLIPLWGQPENTRLISWPLAILAGRVLKKSEC